MKPGKTGISRLINATRYSSKGLVAAFRHEAAFRQELVLAAIGIPVAAWLTETITQFLLLTIPLILLLIVELTNSAIEAVVDRIGDEYHELSGRAKDLGSASVLLTLVLIGLCWGLVLYDIYR